MEIAHHRWPITLLYTLAFLVIGGLSFGVFVLAHRTLIWNMDGITQHYPIMIELHRLLTQKGLAGLAGWSWTFGLGADKLTTLAYYVLGDPFAYLLALFPLKHFEAGYGLFIILRLYATGLAFIPLAKRYHFKPISQLLGTLAYAFTGYSLMVGDHHPFFLLPMIWFPLLLVGIDRIYHGQSWAFLGMVTGIAILSNFYFAYILGLGSLIYAVIRYGHLRAAHDLAISLGAAIRRCLLAAVSGALFAGVLILPSVLMMLQSTRAAAKFANGLWLYPLSYYLKLSNAILTTGNSPTYWAILGMSGLGFLGCVYVLVHWRQQRSLALTLVLIIVGLGFPAVAAFFNVLSTPSNRWLLLVAVPVTLATMVLTDHVTTLTPHDRWWLMGATGGLLLLVYLSNGLVFNNPGRNLITYGLLLALTVVLVGSAHQPAKVTLTLVSGLLGLNLISNAWGYYDPNAGRPATQQLRRGDATKYLKDYYDGAQVVPKADPQFTRVSTLPDYNLLRTVGNNFTMLHGLHGIMSYFSVENGYVGQFSQDLQNSQYAMNSPITQADNRTAFNNLLGVKYLFARQDQIAAKKALPYGYHVAKKVFNEHPVYGLSNGTGTQVLTSKLAFPLVYSQPQALTTAQWRRLSGPDRERSLTQAALVKQKAKNVTTADYTPMQRNLDYTVTANTIPVVDSLNKAIQYRVKQAVVGQKGNLNQQQTANFGATLKAPKFKLDENGLLSAADEKLYVPLAQLNHNRQALDRVLTQNQKIVANNQQANQTGLHQMVSDAQGQPLSYTLTIDRPQAAQGTELYLELDGIQAQTQTTQERMQAADNTSVLGLTPRSRLTKLNDWRDAVRNPDLGDYWVTAKTRNQTQAFSQFGIDNLSDYEPKHRVLLNLGYSRQKRQTVDVTFSATQQINFKSVKLIAMPFSQTYDRQVHAAQQRGLQHAQITDNRVSGTLAAAQPSVLTTSIPYSDGWRLTVDGQATATQVVNDGFVGANLPAGHHRIVLTYRTPGLKLGLWLSLDGALLLLAGGLWHLLRRPLKSKH
ncbi:membrane protein [Levilactobacillus zymae]|uniref:Membrane protein n=1 Tax=Levilactobacillus zymae TaxID=267363 RepID=A0ABQ0WWU0_9LACO|nr:YfhO family protein [Levilactobacillus zymae]KRL12644.1 glycosyltransferase [Levilactobacillus zymae DSM 19395]QFR61952.1 YfhO family protein [Levilactobacillus zymae]GEO72360.1 membrane protein [Levilactobacillus zymae]